MYRIILHLTFTCILVRMAFAANRTCLVGNDAPHPQDFNRVTVCGSHETCYLEEYVTPNGLIRFNAGCKDQLHCQGSSVKSPDISICSQCCNNDICAVSLCGSSGYPTTSGPICYSCPYGVDSPAMCDTIAVCNKDEKCGAFLNHAMKYEIGCLPVDQCATSMTQSTCARCCTDQLCNTGCDKTNVTSVPSCYDTPECLNLLISFHANNKDLCSEPKMQHFCNDSCGLCPTTTAAPTTPHPCTPNPCQNGGTCSIGTGNGNGSVFICTCRIGFSGDMCDRVDLCFYQPCKHGTCSLGAVTGFSCTCDPGLTGILCDTVINPCMSNPCLRGQCSIQGSSYTCNCDVNYVGKKCDVLVQDCKTALDYNTTSTSNDNIYLVSLSSSGLSTNVQCDMTTDGGGWTVIMNRDNGHLNFQDKHMTDYAEGFGDIRGEFWMGLEAMHNLTRDGRHYQLRVELVDASGRKLYQVYDDFSIGGLAAFTLHVGANRGTAGDSLSGHDGFGFSSMLPNIDRDSNAASCAEYLQGSWWFHSCADSCLTCKYDIPGTNNCRSMAWNSVAYCQSLREVRMMVRPM